MSGGIGDCADKGWELDPKLRRKEVEVEHVGKKPQKYVFVKSLGEGKAIVAKADDEPPRQLYLHEE